MAARLYLSNGEAVSGRDAWVFEIRRKDGADSIVWQRRFDLGSEALEFAASNQGRPLLVGCIDPGRSCVDLESVAGLQPVFSSDPLPVSPERPIRAVKVFEVLPQ